ncbi:MAG: hypothetical protein HKO59_17390 [Phycisphaerales bacterium]|nr:hypothetical protein [Phycisphaerae bacterium]NNF42979.1 hypothetical protein [Phycisphaerales bacterium]NNM27722.1 hypothetical protein [Phycisphaerales bacterium]
MSALPLHQPVLKLASRTVPPALRAFFAQAGLAEPPSSVCDLHFDTDRQPGCVKTLLAFTAGRADLNLFLLLSPALQRAVPARIEEDPVAAAAMRPEPDFPWWDPPAQGPARRFAYDTDALDFVEVILDDLTGTVFIRAIG